VNLSICIPGYNRPRYLQWTLDRLRTDFPHAEIVISDDGSTEDFEHLRLNGARWVQQGHIGPFPNLRAALLEGTRKYAVYCANDDYLLPGPVSDALAWMDAHPHVAAYIAPCEVWDEVGKQSFWPAFKCEAKAFGSDAGVDLFNFIIAHHIFPEHVIYRTPAPLKPRTRAFWCFADLPDLLEKGAIYFSPTPFYRNLVVHPVGVREQLGNVQCLTYFDEYRAGLEVLAYRLFGQQPYRARKQIHDMIDAFICTRMECAARLYEQQGETLESEMLRQRLVIADPRPDKPVQAAA
jgi:glycosyltransferase involved in cell wall biosynthesis